ncbi:MAG TPA: transglutaminase-like domain-containing protein, partial [Clostridia bacterium]|nr:transglutaminase-like domain-containing protein [Clostridia bacterium]
PYFNSTGELFVTRDLAKDDVYSVAAPIVTLNAPGLSDALAQAGAYPVADLDAAMLAAYSALPEGIDAEVYVLVRSLTQDKATNLDKLVALRDYLYKNYAYTLTPTGIPPANRDFVSYFLLEGKEGYCTYFASAMAVMARIAGVPTRYVEGFLAVPDATGVAHVTGINAHAWVEAYLDDFGWVSVDATPPESLPQGESGEGDGQQETGGTPEDEGDTPLPPEPSPSPDSGGDTPDPSPSPSPSPSPLPSDNPSSSPSPDPLG